MFPTTHLWDSGFPMVGFATPCGVGEVIECCVVSLTIPVFPIDNFQTLNYSLNLLSRMI